MKKYALTLAAFLMICMGSQITFAQDKTLLFEVSGNGLEKPSYVFGTIHIMCQDELIFPKEVLTSLKRTEQVAFELDLDNPNLLSELQSGFMLEDGNSLESFYSEQEYSVINDYLTSTMGQSSDALSTMKPFFVTSLLYPQFMGCPTASMEISLMNSRPSGSEVVGVETAGEQLSAINSLSLDDQAEMLLEAIQNFDEQKAQMSRMLDLYRNKDVEALYTLASSEFGDAEGFAAIILDERNQNWIPRMVELMESKPTFFAVGAAHLGGNQGVLNLLKAEGYNISPVLPAVPKKAEKTLESLGQYGNLLAGSWKIDEQHIAEIADEAIDRAIENNPEAEAQILMQRSVVEQMVKNTVKTFNPDGTTLIVIPNGGGTQQGTWRVDEEQAILIEVDSEGEESVKQIKELSKSRLVTKKEGKDPRTFYRINE